MLLQNLSCAWSGSNFDMFVTFFSPQISNKGAGGIFKGFFGCTGKFPLFVCVVLFGFCVVLFVCLFGFVCLFSFAPLAASLLWTGDSA